MSAHQFAIYVYGLHNLLANRKSNDIICIESSDLVHRITRVLRYKEEDQIIIFDKKVHTQAKIIAIRKNDIDLRITSEQSNSTYQPEIIAALPLLKKDHMSQALYGLVESGIQKIQLVITQKSDKQWNDAIRSRLERVVIAAAEQSKNYAMAELLSPLSLNDFCSAYADYNGKKLFFDPEGNSPKELLCSTYQQNILFLIGPEGDLTTDEKQLLQKSYFSFIRLTTTILRAQQAACIAGGLLRSFSSI